MEKLISEFSTGLFIWQSIVFVALILLLRKFAWKPILGAVEAREESIEKALESAENAKAEMQNLQADNERLLSEARSERDAMLREAKEIKESIVADAKSIAKSEGDRIIAAAREAINNDKMAAISELKNHVAVLSFEVAEKIVRKHLSDDSNQKELVNNMLDEVKLN